MNERKDTQYIVAVDGGGTKTRLVIGDDRGRLFADIIGAGSNHQIYGQQGTYDVINSLYKQALGQAGLDKSDIGHAVLGLAGADQPADFKMLGKLLQPVFAQSEIEIVNDAWIIMRSGLHKPAGAVCICGTGSNAAAENEQGDRVILRSLDFMLGSYGGGGDIAAQALHFAYRAEEKTGTETMLCQELPRLFSAENLEEMISEIYPRPTEAALMKMRNIAELVFTLANTGDQVCQEILIDMGRILGRMTAGVITRTSQECLEVPVVLGGRVFAGESPLLIDAFTLELHRKVPRAKLIKAWLPPVAGAWLLALEKTGIQVVQDIESNISQALSVD